jgi:hypothetical protein
MAGPAGLQALGFANFNTRIAASAQSSRKAAAE